MPFARRTDKNPFDQFDSARCWRMPTIREKEKTTIRKARETRGDRHYSYSPPKNFRFASTDCVASRRS